MKVFHSRSTNPYVNLAIEDWLLREYPLEEEVWLFYQNAPSVILGRFQNPWLECDLGWMHAQKIPLVRRPSGGGTVWHDQGNVNFCRITPLKTFSKDGALKIIQEKLLEREVAVVINARHDLTFQFEGHPYKVSGSAYKQTKDRSLHHGTLLIQSDLQGLNRALRSPHTLEETRSISSVRSKVLNLSAVSSLTTEGYLELWGDKEVVDHSRFSLPNQWSEWAWQMGETPLFKWRFQVEGGEVYLSSHKGLIHELQWGEHRFEKLLKPLKVETFRELSGGLIDEAQWFAVLGG